MNHDFLELVAREKMRELRAEGLESQAYTRGRSPAGRKPTALPRLALVGLSLLALALIWVR